MDINPGTVYLVGAGPGHPELISVLGARLIRAADLIAYDDLVSPALLAPARPEAELIAVGYRGLSGGGQAPPLLVERVAEAARAGKVVVRLKAGDPLVLARGGDEALALRAAGIAFAFVPGITAALGAAAFAGVPLTHRGLTSGVRLATGHLAGADGENGVGSAVPCVQDTIALYMARRHLGHHCRQLIAAGRPPNEPAVFVIAATTPSQRVIEGTLADLPGRVATDASSGPGIMLAGATVALRRDLMWWQPAGPLAGRRILLARALSTPSKLGRRLQDLGADVIEAPQMLAAPLAPGAELDALLCGLAAGRDRDCDVMVFTDGDAVAGWCRRLGELGLDIRSLPAVPIVAAAAAADHLRQRGLQAEWLFDGGCAAAVSRQPQLFRGRRVLIAADQGERAELKASLLSVGARSVAAVACYQVIPRWPRVVAPAPDLVVAPSSRAMKALLKGDLGVDAREIPTVAIGPLTERAARAGGVKQVIRATGDDLLAVTDAVVALALGHDRYTSEFKTRVNQYRRLGNGFGDGERELAP